MRTKADFEALSDYQLGQEYFFLLDIDLDMANEETRLVVAEFERRDLTRAQTGEPFENWTIVGGAKLAGNVRH